MGVVPLHSDVIDGFDEHLMYSHSRNFVDSCLNYFAFAIIMTWEGIHYFLDRRDGVLS